MPAGIAKMTRVIRALLTSQMVGGKRPSLGASCWMVSTLTTQMALIRLTPSSHARHSHRRSSPLSPNVAPFVPEAFPLVPASLR
jgi:hypothetical protein